MNVPHQLQMINPYIWILRSTFCFLNSFKNSHNSSNISVSELSFALALWNLHLQTIITCCKLWNSSKEIQCGPSDFQTSFWSVCGGLLYPLFLISVPPEQGFLWQPKNYHLPAAMKFLSSIPHSLRNLLEEDSRCKIKPFKVGSST